MLLSKDALLAATTLPREQVQVPELGGAVVVQGLTAAQRDTFEASLFTRKGKHREENLANMRARLLALCLVDERGQRLFSDADTTALGAVRADVANRLFDVAMRLSGLREEDVDELGSPSA